MPAPKTPAHALPPAAPPPHAEAGAVALATAEAIPEPHAPLSDGPLTSQEAAELAACEEAIRVHHLAYVWGVGKALHAISKGRLYRATHARFDAYVEQWDMSPARAYQLMTTWPIARELAVREVVDMGRVNPGQLLALTPVTRDHGVPAAVMVYETVTQVAAEVDGAKVTARVIGKVAGALPAAGRLDRGDIADRAREALAGVASGSAAAHPWEAARDNAIRALRKVAAAGADPAEVLATVSEMRRMLDEIEAACTGGKGGQDGE